MAEIGCVEWGGCGIEVRLMLIQKSHYFLLFHTDLSSPVWVRKKAIQFNFLRCLVWSVTDSTYRNLSTSIGSGVPISFRMVSM
jgi:hypothetical protein